jgi:hypothetical protein
VGGEEDRRPGRSNGYTISIETERHESNRVGRYLALNRLHYYLVSKNVGDYPQNYQSST